MENLITILAAAAALVVGVFGGRALEVRRARAAGRTAEDEAAGILEAAGTEADNLRRAAELQGKEEGYRLKQELLEEAEQRRAELDRIFWLAAQDWAYVPLHQQGLAWGVSERLTIKQRADDFVVLSGARLN